MKKSINQIDKGDPQRFPFTKRLEDKSFWLQPVRKIYATILFVALAISSGVTYYTMQDDFQSANGLSCQRANQVRKESNDRIFSHVVDERNLVRLLTITAHTRDLEAQAWIGLFHVFNPPHLHPIYAPINPLISSLIITYEDASKIDKAIKDNESRIHFDHLPLTNCSAL